MLFLFPLIKPECGPQISFIAKGQQCFKELKHKCASPRSLSVSSYLGCYGHGPQDHTLELGEGAGADGRAGSTPSQPESGKRPQP